MYWFDENNFDYICDGVFFDSVMIRARAVQIVGRFVLVPTQNGSPYNGDNRLFILPCRLNVCNMLQFLATGAASL